MHNNQWDSWGESVAGPTHLKCGVPNQDAWMSRCYKWGNVVVISDGLGSKPHSDKGAKAACLSVLKAAETYQHNPQANISDILRLIHAHWLIKISPFPASECSATCLFVIRLGNQLILARLGDGLIIAHTNSQQDSILLSDTKQDSFSNLTYSLSHEFNLAQWEVKSINADRCVAVVLCTDGIADDLLPAKQIAFTKALYLNYKDTDVLARNKDLKRWMNNWPVPRHSDDKTIACLFRIRRA